MTTAADLRALVADLETLRAAALAGGNRKVGDLSPDDAALIVAAVNAIPAISAGVAALTARLDAAEQVCEAVFYWGEGAGPRKAIVDAAHAWRELSP